MLILEKGIGRDFPEVGGEAAHGEVHLGQFVGGGGEFLPVDGDVLGVAVVAADEFEGLYEHTPGAAAGVVDLAFVRLDHFSNQVHHTLRGIEFTPKFAFRGCEFAEEVFVDAADGVLRLVLAGINVVDGGFNYDCSKDTVVVEPNNGAKLSIGRCDALGSIITINVDDGGGGFKDDPRIYIQSESGYNVKLVPTFKVIRVDQDPDAPVVSPADTIQVIDCVGKF